MFSGAREQGQMAEDDDAVETVVYECEQAPKQPGKLFHRSSPSPALGWHREHGTEDRWRSKPAPPETTPVWAGAPGRFIARCQAGSAEISNIFG